MPGKGSFSFSSLMESGTSADLEKVDRNHQNGIMHFRERTDARNLIFRSVFLMFALVLTLVLSPLYRLVNDARKTFEGRSLVETDQSPTSRSTEIEQLRNVLVGISRNPVALSDPTTPEYAAILWMTARSQRSPDGDSGGELASTAEWRLQQRYAMTVLDLSLQGGNAAVPKFSRGSLDECSWKGITCSNGRVFKIVWSGDVTSKGIMPEDIGLLTDVTHLDLGESDIGGPIPSGLYDLIRLRFLFLHDNRLTGSISDRISQLSKLEKLYLGSNQLHGSIPRGIGSMGDNVRPLRYLQLGENNLNGTIPTNLNLPNIFYIDLSHNRFSGGIPADWYTGPNSFTKLRHLYINNNKLGGEVPKNIVRLGGGRLRQLNLSYNRFTGIFPAGWDPTTFLEALEIQGNNFDGIDDWVCYLSVWSMGEMASFRSDCSACTCPMPFLCRRPRCI